MVVKVRNDMHADNISFGSRQKTGTPQWRVLHKVCSFGLQVAVHAVSTTSFVM
jgi:hypothetical protein